jgi:NitT/TauT family transport system ATP-binding protein
MSMITYDGITKCYGTGNESVLALEDITFSVDDGEFVSIVGPSGCGKSTALHITAGLVDPTKGTFRIRGRDVRSAGFERSEIGLVFQKPILLDWRTVLKNVMLPVEIMHENGVLENDLEHYRERAINLLKTVGLVDFLDSYPNELSGGMQQRVSICRCLVFDPSILLMDEPFGALDEFTRDSLNDELLNIWSETNKTIMFVTHNIEEAIYLADRVIVLSSRPGTIQGDVEIDLERPRSPDMKTESEFNEHVAEVSETLGNVAKQP